MTRNLYVLLEVEVKLHVLLPRAESCEGGVAENNADDEGDVVGEAQLVKGDNVGATIVGDSVEAQEVLTQAQIVDNLPLIDTQT